MIEYCFPVQASVIGTPLDFVLQPKAASAGAVEQLASAARFSESAMARAERCLKSPAFKSNASLVLLT